MRMPKRVPSFFLLVPGPWREVKAVVEVLLRAGIDAAPSGRDIEPAQARVDVVHDGGLGRAMAYGRGGRLPDALVARAEACTSAALIEVSGRLDEDPARVAKIGRALRDAGGVAVRNEASGGASLWEPWIEHLESNDPYRVYASAVVVVVDAEEVFTCGMHQFDLPDAELPDASGASIEWLDPFCAFQVAEQPRLGTGHTFAPDAATPRRKIERWPDHRHHPRDGRHNPFGLWRVLPEGDPGLEALNPSPTPIPTLVSILLATERAKGAPLTREEVERLADGCTAVALSLADSIELERSRGYADLEPRRAWDQWRLVREHHR